MMSNEDLDDVEASDLDPPQSLVDHALRRQLLLRDYEEAHDCRVIALIADLDARSANPLQDILLEIGSCPHIHLLLHTLGGDGEAAIRLVRQIYERTERLTAIVPLQAKSAGTLLVLGATEIVMGPPSDLGPIDPQIWLENYGYKPAKAVVAAFEHAEGAAQAEGGTASFQAQALENRSAIDVQEARESLSHVRTQLRQALANNPFRPESEVELLVGNLEGLLITDVRVHEASISATDMIDAGMPIRWLASHEEHWSQIWQL